ncbi:MAG: HAMP domain-containing histidine kinase [Faecalibacterium sp.]|nr:HAMP domain-containing histidine kinase [Ruminococcus sp.]MCM1391832.1 HAMP domain-containing histidine kinase [Ruminococcus sp.]MCM1485478.1 HAMP domain-containing histidine kinase [Faecalibacterium sp.]
MDTRSKKFNRSMIPKIIAFLLAMMFTALGTVKFWSLVQTAESNQSMDSYYSNLLSQGKDFQLETSEMFCDEYINFMNLSLEKAVVYGNGTEADYKNINKIIEEQVRRSAKYREADMVRTIVDDCNDARYYSVLSYVDDGYVTLKRIADHDTAHVIKGTYSFDEQAYYYNGNYYNDYDEYAYDDDEAATTYFGIENDYEFTEEFDEDEFTESRESEASKPSESQNNSDDTTSTTHRYRKEIIKSTGVPESIVKAAGAVDAVVLICNVDYRGTDIDGYYAVDVNSDAIYKEAVQSYKNGNVEDYSVEYINVYNQTLEEFQENAKYIDSELEKYKNIHFAFVNNATGKVVSDLDSVKSNASAKDLQKIFLSYPWSFVENNSDGIIQKGEKFKEISERDNSWLYRSGLYLSSEQTVMAFVPAYTVYVCFDSGLSGLDVFSNMEETYMDIYAHASAVLRSVVIAALGLLVCIVILVVKSGRHHGDDEIHMLYTDRIYSLLRTIINFGLIAGLVFLIALIVDTWSMNGLSFTYAKRLSCVCTMLIAALLIDWILFIARHVKNYSLMKNLMIVRLFGAIKKSVKKHRQNRKARPAVYRDIFNDVLRKFVLFMLLPNVVFAILILWCFIFEEIFIGILFLIPIVIYDIIAIFYALKYAYSLRKIFYALNQVGYGNYDVKIDTSSMPHSVKAYANDVTALKDGLRIAVDNATKEQRMKTELITNVSHDLKTPLTSIITYVDLLSRCNFEDENAKEYIAVLGEKSAKLKRLIEDLVEASKASSGAVNVELIKVSLNELTSQIIGEYIDEFEERGLTLIEQADDENISILADSKLCYRVFDNLMNNVKKYAMPGTRVYLRIYKQNDNGVISLRNVSENQLNIPASELMSRFVRGDSSRSSDGNGLGLSIAENFCTLQGGKLKLDINGDLFTATVEYKLSNEFNA